MNDQAAQAQPYWDIAYFGSEGSPSRVRLFVQGEGLGMEISGRVVIMPAAKWHALAWVDPPLGFPSDRSVDCRTISGRGVCDMCAQGDYEKCRYVADAAGNVSAKCAGCGCTKVCECSPADASGGQL
jgi:hypothetical protein